MLTVRSSAAASAKKGKGRKGCKLELGKGYISVVVQHVIHRKGYVYVAVGLKLVGKNNVYARPVASQWHAFKPMPLCTQQLRNGEERKKKKRKRKRSGRKGRVHRGVPTFPQHNAASFLHMPAGGCRLNRQGCTLCVCPRGFRPYLYSSSSLSKSLDEIRRKTNRSRPELQPAKPASRRICFRAETRGTACLALCGGADA